MTGYSVQSRTISKGLCTGCGACLGVCPEGALSLSYRNDGTFTPLFDTEKCISCGLCLRVCPQSREKLREIARKAAAFRDPFLYGVKGAKALLSWDTGKGREKSPSGGVLTALLVSLLSQGDISGVLHAKAVPAPMGEPHYQAVLSHTPEELEEGRGSFYGPVSFGGLLKELKKGTDPIAVTGTPCAIRGLKALFTEHKAYSGRKVYFFALSCSHNVTGKFTDALASLAGIDGDTSFLCRLRSKEGAADTNHFHIRFEGEDRILSDEDRYESPFTDLWRSYAFGMKGCRFCSDFWGAEADLSVKDAWGSWALEDPLGKSILLVRNEEIYEKLLALEGVRNEYLPLLTAAYSQRETSLYKQWGAPRRLLKPLRFSLLGDKFRRKAMNATVLAFKTRGSEGVKRWLARHQRRFKVQEKKNALWVKLLTGHPGLSESSGDVGHDLEQRPRILVLGGYGYGNAGDEAQLAANLDELRASLPGYDITVLSPNPAYTARIHPGIQTAEAPRAAFYDQGKSLMYNHRERDKRSLLHSLANGLLKFRFRLRSFWLLLNARLMKRGLPPFLLGARRGALLYALKTSKAVYYSGGGYLTGSTLSRLKDGFVFIRMAGIFRKKVFLSGQTMGLWGTEQRRKKAGRIFRYPSLLGLRDHRDSYAALKEAGIPEEKIRLLSDDALFCAKAENVEALLAPYSLKPGEYLTLNLHYWGADSPKAKGTLMARWKEMGEVLAEKRLPVLLIPMVPTDQGAQREFLAAMKNPLFRYFDYDYDYRKVRSVIGASALCLTMKHHPIIFAAGEGVPPLSLAYTGYYQHKNEGALDLFGCREYSLNLEEEGFASSFARLFDKAYEQKEAVSRRIAVNRKSLLEKRKAFFAEMARILEEDSLA